MNQQNIPYPDEPAREDASPQPVRKKSQYRSPELIEYGNLVELTLSNQMGSQCDNASSTGPMVGDNGNSNIMCN
jgi:hypothetical protein